MNIMDFGHHSLVTWTEAELRRERQEMTEQELLSVLDMSEEEQWLWLCKNKIDGLHIGYAGYPLKDIRLYLADLAFRWRDEARKLKTFKYAQRVVWEKTEYVEAQPFKPMNPTIWWIDFSKPIHWIIASLIAKGKE